jgi:hypothetical protein
VIGQRPTTGLGSLFGAPPSSPVEAQMRDAVAESSAQKGYVTEGALSFLDWAARVPEQRGPLDLSEGGRFHWQRFLYSSQVEGAKEVVVVKGTQIGVSAWLMRWSLRRADRGKRVIYLFPGLTQMADFVRLRVDPLIAGSPYLQRRTEDRALETQAATGKKYAPSTVRLKAVGPGELLLRGSRSLDDLQSVDADALALDEYDRIVQGNIPEAEQRVTGPMSDGMLRRVGVPSIPNTGITKAYRASDMRRWTVRCPMGHWNRIRGSETLADQMDYDTATLVCEECRRPLDVRQGEWVAEHPDRSIIGLHIPKWVMPGTNIRAILERAQATSPAAIKSHRNSDLGEAWQAAEAGLTDENIIAAQRDYAMTPQGYSGWSPVTMGVDVAISRALNVRISVHVSEHQKRALWIGKVDDGLAPWGPMPGVKAFDILPLIMERFNVNMAAIDHMPDGRLVRIFAAKFPGRVWRVRYANDAQQETVRFHPDEQGVSVRQVETIDATVAMVQRQANQLPAVLPDDYQAEMKGRVLDTIEDDGTGKVRTSWVKTGADDYLQCETYDVVATHAYWTSVEAGQAISLGGQVMGASGPAAIDEPVDDTIGMRDSGTDWQSSTEWSPGYDPDA